ncbi:MAG: type II toxin-antitoxin system RelE/ParE family toxin [Micropepsaceae bacterium]
MEQLRVIVVIDARLDLLEIRDYIAQDKPAAANALMARFGTAFALIAAFPNMGRRSKRKPRLRRHVVRGYIVYYEAHPKLGFVKIMRILHGRRKLRL